MVISNESVEPSQPLIDRIIQSIHRVWLDSTIDENRELYCSYVASLRQVINTITFLPLDQESFYVGMVNQRINSFELCHNILLDNFLTIMRKAGSWKILRPF